MPLWKKLILGAAIVLMFLAGLLALILLVWVGAPYV